MKRQFKAGIKNLPLVRTIGAMGQQTERCVAPLPPALTRWRSRLHCIAVCFVLCCMSVSVYHLTKPWALGVPNNSTNCWVFTGDYHRHTLYPPWQSRILGLAMAKQLLSIGAAIDNTGQLVVERYRVLFAGYHAVTSFLAFAAVYWLSRSTLLTLAVYACSVSQWSETAARYAYPWDWPAVFFLCLAVVGWKQRRRWVTLCACLLGVLNKETVFVCCCLYLFSSDRKDIWFGLGLVVIGAVMKLAIVPMIAGVDSGLQFCLMSNAKALLSLNINHPFLACCGIPFAAMMALPYSRDMLGLWCTIVLFLASQLLFGVLHEYRIYNEILPVALLYLVTYSRSFRLNSESISP